MTPQPPRTVDLFVNGRWQPPQAGRYEPATSPVTGELIGQVAQGDRADAAAAVQAAAAARGAWASRHALRAGKRPAPRRRRLPAAAGRAGPGAHPRPGQAAAGRGLPGSRRPHRLLARRGRGRAPPRRRDPAQPTAGRPGPHRAPPARRGRGHHPVELALHDAGPGHRAGAGRRQHGRVDPRAEHVGLQRGADGRHRRRGPAARGGRLPARPRPGRRRRDRRPSGRRRRRVRRVHPDRPVGGPARGGQGPAAGDGQQRPAGGHGRRRPGPGGRGHARRRLPVRRPELYRRRARPGPRADPRRVRGKRWPPPSPRKSCSATHSTRRPRWGR